MGRGRGGGATAVCVPHSKVMFPPIYIQHNQCISFIFFFLVALGLVCWLGSFVFARVYVEVVCMPNPLSVCSMCGSVSSFVTTKLVSLSSRRHRHSDWWCWMKMGGNITVV